MERKANDKAALTIWLGRLVGLDLGIRTGRKTWTGIGDATGDPVIGSRAA